MKNHRKTNPAPARSLLFLALVLGLPLTFGSGCFRNETFEHVFSIPALTNETCSALVSSVVFAQDGVLSATPDLENQTLHVTWNSRLTALKNIEVAIKNAGFDVDESIGRPAARDELPEACR